MKRKKLENKICKVGDVFSIPFEQDFFGFARIVNIKDGWDLAQLFSYTSDKQDFTQDIYGSSILYPPFSFNLRDVESGKLKIITSDPQFLPAGLDLINFYMGGKGNHRLIKINDYRPGTKITNDEALLLPRMEFYSLEGMIHRAKVILSNNKERH